MMRSMFSGVSGLKNHQVKMDVIGNNIANVNTAGFKSSRVTFQEALNQTINSASMPGDNRGGINPVQVGMGVRLGSIDVLHEQGAIESTDYTTDLAIDGNGFFVLSDGNREFYTRAGNFEFDGSGNLVSKINGMRVMGYGAGEDGEINIAQHNFQSIAVRENQNKLDPIATSEVRFGGNLTVAPNVLPTTLTTNQPLPEPPPNLTFSGIGGNDPTITMTLNGSDQTIELNSSYDSRRALANHLNSQLEGITASLTDDGHLVFAVNNPAIGDTLSISSDYSASPSFDIVDYDVADASYEPVPLASKVYDSLGGTHTIETVFTKVGNNQWNWEAFLIREDEDPISLGDGGEILFTENGRIRSGGTADIRIPAGELDPKLAEDIVATLDFGGFTQYTEATSATVRGQNGFPSGALDSIDITPTGLIVGSYSNGLTRNLGQIGMARFENPAGLAKTGNTMFGETLNSGDRTIGVAGTNGLGTIAPSSLEMSNVDLSQEFTDMIITQRGFQANSRIITSSDEMLQELVNLKR